MDDLFNLLFSYRVLQQTCCNISHHHHWLVSSQDYSQNWGQVFLQEGACVYVAWRWDFWTRWWALPWRWCSWLCSEDRHRSVGCMSVCASVLRNFSTRIAEGNFLVFIQGAEGFIHSLHSSHFLLLHPLITEASLPLSPLLFSSLIFFSLFLSSFSVALGFQWSISLLLSSPALLLHSSLLPPVPSLPHCLLFFFTLTCSFLWIPSHRDEPF